MSDQHPGVPVLEEDDVVVAVDRGHHRPRPRRSDLATRRAVRADIVLDIIKGKTRPADTARLHGYTVADVESWVDEYPEGGKEDLLAKVGELTLQVDAAEKGTRSAPATGPYPSARSAAGSACRGSPPVPPARR
jgi:hypothetical protein